MDWKVYPWRRYLGTGVVFAAGIFLLSSYPDGFDDLVWRATVSVLSIPAWAVTMRQATIWQLRRAKRQEKQTTPQ